MAINTTGAYFQKTVGVVPTNSVEEQELAVTYLARRANGPGDLRTLLEHLGLDRMAKHMLQRSA